MISNHASFSIRLSFHSSNSLSFLNLKFQIKTFFLVQIKVVCHFKKVVLNLGNRL